MELSVQQMEKNEANNEHKGMWDTSWRERTVSQVKTWRAKPSWL